nr:uncharacterized protein LOC109184184 [Ipomoea batatas]
MTRRRGKSPRVVITHFYDRLPTYSPTSRDALQKTLPPQPCLLTVTELEEVKSLLTGRVEFQTQSYEYWIFRSPASVAAANLEPPDYSKPEKYVPKKAAAAILPVSVPESVNPGMVLERSFAPAPSGPKKTRPKVTLGGRGASQSLGAPSGLAPPAPQVVGSTEAPTGAADLPLTRAPSKRGKEKTADPEVEEIPPLKKQKRPHARGSNPVLDALREGGEQTASLLE